MQINLIGSFDCNYWGDAEDISHLLSFGKFCLPLPGKKIVCKISENCKGWQAAHLHWRKTFENLLHIASVRRTLSGILHFKHWMMIWLGSNGGVVVRALPSHQCGPGSIPRSDAICGLSLLLVLSLAPRDFSPGTLVFPSPQNQHFQIPIRPGIR